MPARAHGVAPGGFGDLRIGDRFGHILAHRVVSLFSHGPAQSSTMQTVRRRTAIRWFGCACAASK